MEAKIRLEQAKKDKELGIKAADKEIAALEKQIAAEAKPELRHGECFHDGCNSLVTIKTDAGWHRMYLGKIYPPESESQILSMLKDVGYKPTGFAFPAIDDLKAMQADLTSFKTSGLKATVKDGLLWLTAGDGREVWLTLDDNFEMQVRQANATLKRNKK